MEIMNPTAKFQLLAEGRLELVLQFALGQRQRVHLVLHLRRSYPTSNRFRLVLGQLVEQSIPLLPQYLYIILIYNIH